MKPDKKDILKKLGQEYRFQEKPVHYDYKIPPTSVPQRKFGLLVTIIKQFIQIGMKPEYVNEEDQDKFYWNELQKRFATTYEMDFVVETVYGKKKQKIRDLIVIILHTKKLFELLDAIRDTMGYLYLDQSQLAASKNSEEMQLLDFLRDNQYTINSEMLLTFDQYCQNRALMEETERRRKQRQKQEQERRIRQQKEKQQKQRLKLIEEQMRLEKSRQQEEERHRIQAEHRKRIEEEEKVRRAQIDASWVPTALHAYYQNRPQSSVALQGDVPHQTNTPASHSKRSRILYEEVYKQQMSKFAFSQEPVPSQQKSECYQCHNKLGVGLYFIGYNLNYCNYKGTWYCNNCYSTERKPLPWKAKHDFDLRGYGVCAQAAVEITSLYEKPILQINNDSRVVQMNRVLFNFLYLKRQIHLMYDLICNPDLIKNCLKGRMNYCLKENIFSLKNLYDIYSEQEHVYLEKIVELLTTHFYQCTDCQKKGYKCMTCKKKQRIFPFELRETRGCPKCERLYHRECINSGGCLCSFS